MKRIKTKLLVMTILLELLIIRIVGATNIYDVYRNAILKKLGENIC